MVEIKRYYPFGEETLKLWQNCPNLRSILGEKWLERQSQNPLYWQAHPLFIHFCNNSLLIPMLEITLKQSSPQNLSLIEKNLKGFGTRANIEGFFSELFIMTRLISKTVKFEYTPNKEGVDFILPELENLHIEVTSRQAESWDGRSEAMMRWKECLPIFKTGLSLLLIDAQDTSQLSDWLEGFEYFGNYVKERKGSIQIDDRILPRNNNGVELAHISVEGINNDPQKPTHISFAPQVRGIDLKKETQKLLRLIMGKTQKKACKSQPEPFVLLLDLTHRTWLDGLALFMPKQQQIIRRSLEAELTKYPHVIHLMLFQRDFINMDISSLLSIPNPNPTLARNDSELFQKARAIFQ